MAEKLLSSEVIFKEDLVEIFGERMWDKKEEIEEKITETEEKEAEEEIESSKTADESKPVISKEEDLKNPPEFKPKETKEEKDGTDE